MQSASCGGPSLGGGKPYACYEYKWNYVWAISYDMTHSSASCTHTHTHTQTHTWASSGCDVLLPSLPWLKQKVKWLVAFWITSELLKGVRLHHHGLTFYWLITFIKAGRTNRIEAFLWIRHHSTWLIDWTVINWTTGTWDYGLHLSGLSSHQAKHCTDEHHAQWGEQRLLLCREVSLVAVVLNHIHNSHIFTKSFTKEFLLLLNKLKPSLNTGSFQLVWV